MDAGIHANVHEAHPETTSPHTNVGPFPPEIVDIVLFHAVRHCYLLGPRWQASTLSQRRRHLRALRASPEQQHDGRTLEDEVPACQVSWARPRT
ncbi:hypothetical protein K466DRAFT_384913 [Polyporus arcularius HHB13444]|uniref:Uncharacterized protein n=1 Tax=Polyporus arcularius HHB13444 TaxID=1314778 RepID=A0A5C3PMA8_9APHY|nr:hypothetical protein K466DRAFT_384913 [Polyporus arcularius HHB13444]